MTRVYIQPSWINAAEDHTEWSGGNDQYRGDRSVDITTFDKNGRARVEAFSDEAIAARNGNKKATKVPLKQRILPQAARAEKLHSEILELEAAYKSGEFSPADYTLLREVAFKKYNRAQELLKRAVKPVEKVKIEEETYANSFSNPSDNNGHGESFVEGCGVDFIDELSETNSLKSFLKMSCKVVRKAVQLSQAARNYYNELKAI